MKKLLQFTLSAGSLLVMAAPAFAQTTDIGVPRLARIVQISDVGRLIGNALAIMLIIAAILAFIYLILGGIQWITSGGDKAGLEAARNKITNAIVGLIIVAAAWAIMFMAANFLGLEELFSGKIKIPTAFE